jgi:voltage-dependent anion channel protein 2
MSHSRLLALEMPRPTGSVVIWKQSGLTRRVEPHAKGLKLELISTLIPDKQAKNALIASTYKQPGFHTRQHLDLFKGPTVTADAVLGRDGFLAGAEATYDVKDGRLSKYNLAAGFHAPEYAVTLHALNNLNLYTASYYHRVNPDIETSARATYDTKGPASQVNLEVGTKTYLDNAAFVKAKINNAGKCFCLLWASDGRASKDLTLSLPPHPNAGILCLGYTQALRPGVKASLGLALDTVKLADTGATAHKVGATMTFEA